VGTTLFVLIGLIILLLLITVTAIRRRRGKGPTEDVPVVPTPAGDLVDYTSMPIEEQVSWRDRFNQMPPARRALLALLGVVLILGLAGLLWALSSIGAGDQTAEVTPVPPGEISNLDAVVASPDEIGITARTNLPPGTQIAAELTMDGQPFQWYTDESAFGQVEDGRIDMTLVRDPAAPLPNPGSEFRVTLVAQDLSQTTATGDLVVPATYNDAFFGIVPTAAATPTPLPEPTEAPTAVAEATAAPTEAPAPEGPILTASVFNGGNVRAQPSINGEIVGGINAGETVTLTQKTEAGDWYFLETIRGEQGWSSATLLTVDAETAALVPVLGDAPAAVPEPAETPEPGTLTAVVFNGGNVREQPNLSGRVVGGVNAGENVTLLQKTESGQWFEIRTPRGEQGWVSVTLLTIDPAVREQVPVAGAGTAPGNASDGGDLTAVVFNGGNVRAQPSINGAVVGGVNAGENVTLLQKTQDGQWYRLRTIRGEEGWASVTLLTIAPSVASQVPVAP
jgi:uncharacterized protein YgiM (DUF1202 family)